MTLFSERYGFIKPSDVIIRENITIEIQNAICSCYDELRSRIGEDRYLYLQEYIWKNYYNKRKKDFWDECQYSNFDVFINSFENENVKWFEKIDLIDLTFCYFRSPECPYMHESVSEQFQLELNNEFKRLNFAYRLISGFVVEVNSEEEVNVIKEALTINSDAVKEQLTAALKKLSMRDYQGSIKESVSALEAFTREISGNSKFSLNWLQKEGIEVHSTLKEAFNKLYGYTCDGEVGIRHPQMNPNSPYTPTSDEAVLMLVAFSSIINYFKKKISNK